MTITVNTKAYNADGSVNANTVLYTGPNATYSLKDALLLARTAPKPTADFPGMAKARAKFTRTVEYSTGNFADAIVEVNVSVPVGMSEAAIDSIRDDMGDFLISSNGDDLFFKHDISQ
jgi:hypothetical protein